jgi:hypothetical protein
VVQQRAEESDAGADSWGRGAVAEKILTPQSAEILLEITMRRYENRSTLVTSNRPVEEWGKLLSDVPAASAILDRSLHHAEVIPIAGGSYRLQQGAERRSQQNPKQGKIKNELI